MDTQAKQIIDELEDEILTLELENNELKKKMKITEFEQFKLHTLQELAKAGSWELNRLSYDLKLSNGLSSLIYDKSSIEKKISFDELLDMFVDMSDQDIKNEIREKVIKKNEDFILEHILINHNGDHIFVRHHCKTLYNSIGQPLVTVGLILDINKLTKHAMELDIANKKANSAVKSKSEFLANMSHEVRTPLNAILGFISLLKKESVGRSKSLEYINIVESSSKTLLNTIDDILDFSKIESGKLTIEPVDFNVKDELSIITNLFDAKCSEKNLTLLLTFEDNLPQAIKSDPHRIKQIVSNLLSNAVKFTESGKNIEVKIGFQDKRLKISVQDEGKGIAQDKLSHIFEAFSQEDNSTTREFGGTGLGLSISNELVRLLGGDELKVKSEIGIGSEFYFDIPVEIVDAILSSNEEIENISFIAKKLLVVEDNKSNQLFMSILLEDLEIDCDIANDGVEAVAMFKSNKYDAILMDENMPNMSGIEATKHIVEYEKQNSLTHTPIIALTANALKGDREKFLDAGMDEYITKPLEKTTLIKTLSIFLK